VRTSAHISASLSGIAHGSDDCLGCAVFRTPDSAATRNAATRAYIRALEAEILFLRRQLALYVERGVKPRRIDAATREMREHFIEQCRRYRALAARFEQARAASGRR
jgi:hypothetical protein